jgi:hypothetical protein
LEVERAGRSFLITQDCNNPTLAPAKFKGLGMGEPVEEKMIKIFFNGAQIASSKSKEATVFPIVLSTSRSSGGSCGLKASIARAG